MSVLSELQIAKNVIGDNGIKCVLYGTAGTFKTRSATTARNAILLDVENGVMSLKDSNVPIFCANRDMNRVHEFFNFLKTPEAKQFETVFIDSLSEITTICLNKHLPNFKDGRQAYREMNNEVMGLLEILLQIPQNVVMICKQETIELPAGVYQQPAFEGKTLYTKIVHMFDLILKSDIRKVNINGKMTPQFTCTPKNTNGYLARDRTGLLEDIIPLNFDYIFNIIKGE